jgi:UDP-N-acetylglucosamine 2-epimerase (non-hydrolysing)
MKVAPLWHALSAAGDFKPSVIHTGQHYDANMSSSFFQDLRLPEPHQYLGIGSASHAVQTAGVMIAYEAVVLRERPDWVIVPGDVNSTLACALVAAKLGIPLVHLEAGLRSGDRSMPEEINRIVTDALADVLWTPSPDADENLFREGIPPERVTRVGNIMLDSFEMLRPQIEAHPIQTRLGLTPRRYGVVTLHRPANVDNARIISELVAALVEVQRLLPLVFPVHPRAAARLEQCGLLSLLHDAGVKTLDPLPYIGFMRLISGSAVAITDSGGIQEETSYLGIPCLTLRKTTERPVTVTLGTNRLVEAQDLAPAVREILRDSVARPIQLAKWDGRTALRCLDDLRARVATRQRQE